jgi:hypothetical protein
MCIRVLRVTHLNFTQVLHKTQSNFYTTTQSLIPIIINVHRVIYINDFNNFFNNFFGFFAFTLTVLTNPVVTGFALKIFSFISRTSFITHNALGRHSP